MKYFKFVIFVILIAFIGQHSINAQENETIALDSASPLDYKNTLSSFVFLKEEPEKYSIQYFDVSENGNFAVISEKSNEKYVSVYDKKGEYLYGYRFNTFGSAFLEWRNGILSVYAVRAGIFVSLPPEGNCSLLGTMKTSSHNNRIEKELRSSIKQTAEGKYEATNDMGVLDIFATSYSKLKYTSLDGTETILYSATNEQDVIKWVPLMAILIIPVFIIACLIDLKIITKENLKKTFKRYPKIK